jgi:hypothetical protein
MLLGMSTGATALGFAYGNTTISGPVTLGSGSVLEFRGAGNVVVSGLISGFDQAPDRLIKTWNVAPNTLTLSNPNNSFLSSVRIDQGFVRVSNGGALGRNTLLSGGNA